MADFLMPSLGADMEAGTLASWQVSAGDRVARGQIIAVVETDKGAIEVEIWQSGIVERLLAEPGTKVPVGAPLAVVRGDDEAAMPPIDRAPVPPIDRAPPLAPELQAAAAPPAEGRVRASPAARQRARELGVDLAHVAGTGPHGTVSLADVEKAAEKPAPIAPPPPEPVDARAAMRRAIAAAMTRSKREIPHYYLATEIDLGRALAWLAAQNLALPISERILPAALLLRAVAIGLARAPELNGFFVDGAHRPSAAIHLGVAISLRGGGLVAPAVHDADKKTIPELMRALADLTQRARAGTLRSSELADPTITVTSLGEQGADEVIGVVQPPQVAIVGFGRIRERPWAEGGLVHARPTVVATLSADHRVSDGHAGSRFLAAVDAALQQPEQL
jgi:pyruvate dehydrogenase E2 component (dihydrolipoamide acetyltransferase)